MDHGHFDDLTRSVASGEDSRRGVLRLLAGSALGILAAELGLVEVAAANKKKSKRKRRADENARDAVQAEGKKGKGKKKKKKRKKLP